MIFLIDHFFKKDFWTANYRCVSNVFDIYLQGYSYVAPSVIFSENTISNNLLCHDNSNQPRDIQIRYASHFKVTRSNYLVDYI